MLNTDTCSDLILIARCREGDQEAQDSLFSKHQERAQQYAFKLMGDADQAADVVSEAFLKVFRALDQFNGDCAFTTWLYRIIANSSYDMRKKNGRWAMISLDTPNLEEAASVTRFGVDGEPSPYEIAVSSARSRKLNEAMRFISPDQRAVLSMVHTDKYSHGDIAANLRVPVGTVKSRLFMARKRVREILRDESELFDMA